MKRPLEKANPEKLELVTTQLAPVTSIPVHDYRPALQECGLLAGQPLHLLAEPVIEAKRRPEALLRRAAALAPGDAPLITSTIRQRRGATTAAHSGTSNSNSRDHPERHREAHVFGHESDGGRPQQDAGVSIVVIAAMARPGGITV